MSDLGAIFHVKKDGVQYDAHAYTTIDECPEPNLKIKFRGQQGYVKLEQGKGNGDVPCYAKNKSGVIYQVRKEAIPTGSKRYPYWFSTYTTTFTVPNGVYVIRSYSHFPTSQKPIQNENYIGVTPGKTYSFNMIKKTHNGSSCKIVNASSGVQWQYVTSGNNTGIMLEWSPEINKHSVDISDY